MKKDKINSKETSEVLYIHPEEMEGVDLKEVSEFWAQISESLANK